MARDLYRYFRIEARDLLDQLSRAALDLEKGTTPALISQLLRLAHTLKGAARVVKRADVGDRAHAIEDALAPLRGTTHQATRAQIDTVLHHLDEINGCLAALPAAESPAVPHDAAAVAAEEVPRTVRVDIGEMDTLLDGFVEAHAQLGALRGAVGQIERIRDLTDLLGAQVASRTHRAGDACAALPEERLTQDVTEQIAASLDGLSRSFVSGIDLLDRELGQVHDAAERMRLIPADSLFIALERAARDAAQVGNKKVTFEGRGGAVRLDAQILGTVQSALSHAVRNAVVHGIETPAERRAAGKPAVGQVTLEVARRGQRIAFVCADDGRGIDLDAIGRIATRRGLLPNAAAAADTEALLQLLLKGGITTQEQVTAVAGRGIGLDVVRHAAEQLEGTVELHTVAGKGTTLTLTVPLSMASLEALLLESSGVIAAIPIDAVRHTLRIAPGQIARNAHGETVVYEARTYPFVPLASALSSTARAVRANRTWSAVIVEAGDAAAIGVDRLLGIANVVLRPLPALAPAAAIVAGVSLDVGGNPQLVLDPTNLVRAAQRAAVLPPQLEQARPVILVIDDSLTTRMLERSILESAGYEVDLAISGEDAIAQATAKPYALFLVDVEMPGMDGFTFIERTRADPQLRSIPAILVTSRASPEDLQRGRDVGASGHVIKSEFDQGVLLARIGELVGR